MSLDTMQIWPFRYVLRCQPRNDLDRELGTLPPDSYMYMYYIGSTSHTQNGLCFHMQSSSSGTLWTKRFQPLSVEKLCVRRPSGTKQCLAWEDDMVIEHKTCSD